MSEINPTVPIRQFLDEEGRITQLPRKQKAKIAVLAYLATRFSPNETYTEQQVNGICNTWHTFGDYTLLRRELVDFGFLGRERDGTRYWLVPQPTADADPDRP